MPLERVRQAGQPYDPPEGAGVCLLPLLRPTKAEQLCDPQRRTKETLYTGAHSSCAEQPIPRQEAGAWGKRGHVRPGPQVLVLPSVPLNPTVDHGDAGDGEVGAHKPVRVRFTVYTEGQAHGEGGTIRTVTDTSKIRGSQDARIVPEHSNAKEEHRATCSHPGKRRVDQRVGTNYQQREQRVGDLRRQLQDAELELALEKRSATMRGVTCDESDSKTVQLGPTVYADLEFVGCRVNALVDTGSPATIVSLDFLLDSLTKGRAKEQTPTEWKSEVRHRLKPPEVTLHSYGGGGLDIVGQILVTLRCGPHHHTAVVLVQKQAPEALLLGTDLQPYLGFRLSRNMGEGSTVELLTAPKDKPDAEAGSLPTVVRLLQAQRLPARHGHIVRTQVNAKRQEMGQLLDPKKVTVVREFTVPEDFKALRSFVGLASYYRRFIPSFSKVAAPLFELTKKDKSYRWTAECQAAFDRLKQLLTKAPVLAYPRFDAGFRLETDASGVGLGAVLAQQQEDGTV